MVIFFDIDGTIVDDGTQIIPRSTVDSVEKLRALGHIPVVNTGRPYSHIDPRVRSMAFSAFVCGCGMEIFLEDRWLVRKSPDLALCEFVRQQAKKQGVLPLYEADDGAILYEPELVANPSQKREMERMEAKGFRVCPAQEHPQFMKFVIWSQNAAAAQAFYREMEPYFEIIYRGNDSFAEFVLKGCSKAVGMETLLSALGVSREDTLAIGDSTNDLPMFSVAAHTACLGDGMEELKAVSEYVTAPVLEDGIQKALEHFGLLR